MISGIVKRVLPCTRRCLITPSLIYTSRGSFSRVDKFNEFKMVLDHEIKDETQNLTDLSSY
jgi:hypothetical protein